MEIGARRRHRGRAGERDRGNEAHRRGDEIRSMTHHSVLPDCVGLWDRQDTQLRSQLKDDFA